MYLKDWSYFDCVFKNWIQCDWKFYFAPKGILIEWNFEKRALTWKYHVTYIDWSFYDWNLVNWLREWFWKLCTSWLCYEWEFHNDIPIWEHKIYIGLQILKCEFDGWKTIWEPEFLSVNPLGFDPDFMNAYDKYRKDINLIRDNFSKENPSLIKKSSWYRESTYKSTIKKYNNMLKKINDQNNVEKWIIEFFIHIHETMYDFIQKNKKSEGFSLNYNKKFSGLVNEFLNWYSSILMENNINIDDLSDYSFGSFYTEFSKIVDYLNNYTKVDEQLSNYRSRQQLFAVFYTSNKNIFNEMLEEYKDLIVRFKDAYDAYSISLKEFDKFEKEFWKHHLKK